tara:strand:- start:690 stop:2033 length:1344 start_codon:yes stop_codon:yes gene_type:complete
MAIIPEDFNIGESPNNSFENLFITGKLNYEFSNDEITVQKLNVTGTSSFASDVTFTGDITLDEITARNANVTGVATVGTGLYLNGKLFDGDGDFGTAGQLLSSDGTDLNWIDASTTSVANANNVGTNVNSGNADNFITFVGASSGNNPIRVDADLKYNPSTNTLSAINIAGSSTAVNLNVTGNLTVDGQFKDGDGNFGTSGQVLSSDGTDTAWINAGSLTAGAAAEVGVSAATVNADHFITMVDTASGNENIRVDTDLTYNPVTNTLNVPNISGNGSGLSGIEAFVTGMIILWSGAANAIPSGFVLCNGSNSTPDLRNRFVVGAGDSYSVGNSGGSNDVTLSTSQLPSHNHSFSGSQSHDHGYAFASGSGGAIGNNYNSSGIDNVTNRGNLTELDQSGGPDGQRLAGFTADTGDETVTISGTSGSTGSGGAIENRPPYYALCYIMKT